MRSILLFLFLLVSPLRSFSEELKTVIKVIDPITVITSEGTKIKYIGIDYPHFSLNLAQKSLEINKRLTLGKKIRLEFDRKKTGKHSEVLAYVYVITNELEEGDEVDNKIIKKTRDSQFEIFINAYLLKKGFVKTAITYPNTKYMDYFLELEEEARINKRGLFKEKFYW